MPFLSNLQRWAEERPDSPAVIIGQQRMTWSELGAAAAAAVPSTPSVSILEGNNCLDLVVQFAAAVAGDRQCVVLDPTWPSQIRAEIIDRLPPSEAVEGVDLIDGDPASPFLISLTSGTTTSFPKAVSRTRMSWRMSFEASGRFFGLRPDDRTLAPGSLAAGLNLFALAECLYNGSPFQALESFDVAHAHEAITHDGVTRLILVPSALRLLSERGLLGGIDASGIRTIICAGSKLDFRTLQAAQRWAPNANIFEYYGAAEVSFVSAKLRVPGESAECDTTLGRPWTGVAVQICGNDGSPLADGHVGSIHVRSDLASDGYLWDGTGTARKPADGWWTVGDDGFLRDGELHLLGRRSDVITAAGNMVYPHEVELALTSVPGVAAAVVAGIPAPRHDQQIVAGIIALAGGITANFLEAAMERLLDSAKLPSQYFLLSELPLTDRGKVSRRVLVDWVQAHDARAFSLGRDYSTGVFARDHFRGATCQAKRKESMMTAIFEGTGNIPGDRGKVLEGDAAVQPRCDTVRSDGHAWGAVDLGISHCEHPLEGFGDTSTLAQRASSDDTSAAEQGSGTMVCFPWEGLYQDVEAPRRMTLETFLHSNMYGE